MTDEEFFKTFPERQAHIRNPDVVLVRDKQRAAFYAPECEREFRTLGPHTKSRRRIILWRVPRDSQWYDPRKPPLLKIPFLAFADETIEDDDAILLPILHEIMMNARMS